MKEWVGEKDGWMDGWVEGHVSKWMMDGGMSRRMGAWVGGRTSEWVGGWMD